MSIQYDETLLDFDLDFLHQTGNKSVVLDKPPEKTDRCRKSVSLVKKKIVATDSLIRKYYEKKDEVEQVEKTLNLSKEEYKQTCIEFQNIVQKCHSQENEVQMLRKSNMALQEKYEHSQNIVGAMQSHANQLQNLVKQNETTIESLTIENQLQKANVKDYEKKNLTLQKKNDDLMRHICLVKDVVLGKRKLNKHLKEILLKYNTQYESDDNDSLFGDQNSDHETDTEVEPSLECTKEDILSKKGTKKNIIEGEEIGSKDDHGHESDCSNGLASADTGRGSSLAFSDGEKCFNSPDYFVSHSPYTADIVGQRKKHVDAATSPIPFADTVHVATSPAHIQYENIQITLSPMSTHDADPTDIANCTEFSESHVKKDMESTSEKEDELYVDLEIQSNDMFAVNLTPPPMVDCDQDSDTCVDEEASSASPVLNSDTHQSVCSRRSSRDVVNERECLDLNNSNNLDVNNAKDSEIEMIFQRMRLNHKLLTPIPNSPSKSRNSTTRAVQVETAAPTSVHEVGDGICKDAEKVREENKILNAKLIELAQEIVNIKDILRNKQLLDYNTRINNPVIHTPLNDTTERPRINTDITDFSAISPTMEIDEVVDLPLRNSQKSSEVLEHDIDPLTISRRTRDEDVYQVNNNITTNSHLTHSTIDRIAINKGKVAIPDNLRFVEESPVASITNGAAHKNNNNYLVDQCPADPKNNSMYNSSICEGIDDDSLPLSDSTDALHDTTEKDLGSPDSSINHKQSVNGELHSKNKVKHRKLTKLEKMRNKLLPKSKIKSVSNSPIKKMHVKPKQVSIVSSKQVSHGDSAASLNDKSVYEKALRVMSEIKSKAQSKRTIKKKLRNNMISRDAVKNNDGEKIRKHLNKPNSPCENTKLINEDERIVIENVDVTNEIGCNNVNKISIPCDKTLANKVRKSVDREVDVKNVGEKEKVLSNVKDKCERDLIVAVVKCDDLNDLSSPKKLIATRSKSKCVEEVNVTPRKSIEEIGMSPRNTLGIMSPTKNTTGSRCVEQLNVTTPRESVEKINVSPRNISGLSSPIMKTVRSKYAEQLNITDRKSTEGVHISSYKDPVGVISSVKKIVNNKCVDEGNRTPRMSIEEINISPRMDSKDVMTPSKKMLPDSNNDIQTNHNEKGTVLRSGVIIEDRKLSSRKRPKRASLDQSDIQCKRMLRSSTLHQSKSEEECSSPKTNTFAAPNSKTDEIISKPAEGGNNLTMIPKVHETSKEALNYDDLSMFTCDQNVPSKPNHDNNKSEEISPKDSIFCMMMDKYGKRSIKTYSNKISDTVISSTGKQLEKEIASIMEASPQETKDSMNKLVETILNWGHKQFMAGLMAYLKDPKRKVELFNKIYSPPAPPMTKSEQILLYVITQLKACWSSVDIVDSTLCNIEFMLFKLNRTPEFDAIESASHFYAVLCRYFNMKSRLRLLMLDAMYCIQFKAVPLIKQCMDVWMHVLPLAHMGIAKSPLVTCMVYLLHFYKCEDRFNRVQDIRNILNRKYFYEITDWNEPKIIEMFKNAIQEIRALPIEIKMLRISLIVIAKRNGPRWCQNNIIKKLLLPIIDSDASERVKAFSISLLGPLLKPYPVDMKVHCEIVLNQLLDILKQNPTHAIQEAVFTSLIYMNKHNQMRVLQALLEWKPKRVSSDLEMLLKDFVNEKPIKAWKTVLSKVPVM